VELSEAVDSDHSHPCRALQASAFAAVAQLIYLSTLLPGHSCGAGAEAGRRLRVRTAGEAIEMLTTQQVELLMNECCSLRRQADLQVGLACLQPAARQLVRRLPRLPLITCPSNC
jgi:hypothetical protein